MEPKFTVTFDELDELEKQPENIQNQVLGSLSAPELQVYSDVAAKHQQFKAMSGVAIPSQATAPAPAPVSAPVSAPAPAPVSSAPVPAPAVPEEPSYFQKKLDENAAQADGMLGLAMAPVNAAVQSTLGRAVGAFQENVGAPAVNALADRLGPTGKLLTKQALSFIAGQENVEQMDEKELLAAVNTLEDVFTNKTLNKFVSPETAAATAQFTAQTVGEAPLMLIRAPKAVAAVAEAAVKVVPELKLGAAFVTQHPTLAATMNRTAQAATRVATTAAVGAAEGVAVGAPVMLLTQPEAKLTEAVGVSALFGAGIGAGAGAVVEAAPAVSAAARKAKQQTVQTAKVVGAATVDGVKTLAGEVQSAIRNSEIVRESQRMGLTETMKTAPGEGARSVKLVDDLKQPSFVHVVDGPKGPVARVVEIRPSLMSESILYHDLPLTTPKDQARVGALLDKHGISLVGAEDMPRLMEDPGSMARLRSGKETVQIVTPEGIEVRPVREARMATPEERAAVLLADDGALVVKPVVDDYKAPNDPIAVGDDVVVAGRAGEERGTVVGAGADGAVKVETPSGTRDVDMVNVRHVPEPSAGMNPQHVRDILNIIRRGGDSTVAGLAEQLGLAQTDIAALLKAMRERGALKKGWVAEAGGAQRLSQMGEEVWSRLPPEQRPAFPKQRDTALPTDPILYDDASFFNDPTKQYPVLAHPDSDIQRLQLMQHMHRNGNVKVTPTELSRLTDLKRGEAVEALETMVRNGMAERKGKTGYVLTQQGSNIARNTLKQVGLDPAMMAKLKPESNLLAYADELAAAAKDRPIDLESFRSGDPVMIERAPGTGEGFERAEFLGRDPNKDGFARIKYGDNTVRSEPMGKVFSLNPPGTSKGPLFTPLAPVAPRPDTVTGRALARLDAAQQAALSKAAPMLEKILPAHLYVADDLAHMMLRLDGAKYTAGMENKITVLRSALKQSGQKLLSDFDKDIGNVVTGRMTPEKMTEKYPEAWSEVRNTVEPLIRRSRELDSKLADLGYVDESKVSARLAGQLDYYSANIYRAYIMPRGEWSKMVSKDVVAAAKKYLMDEAKLAKTIADEPTIDLIIKRILNAEDPADTFAQYAKRGGISPKSYKHLTARKDIPEPIRQLLGPEESGTLRLAYSLAQQEAIYHSLKAVDDIYKARVNLPDGTQSSPYWSLRNDEGRGLTVKVPEEPKKYGRLAGKYVTKQLSEYLSDHTMARDNVASFFRTLVVTRKIGQVALNPVTWFNATVGNIEASVLAGGLDFHPRSVLGMAEALQQMKTYSKTGDAYRAPLIHEAKKYGVDTEGFLAKEYGYSLDIMTKAVKEATQDGGNILSVLERIKDSPKLAVHGIGKMYNLIDRTFKLANYASLRRKFLSEAAEKGLVGEAAVDYAASKASFRIAQSFPMPYRPNKLAQAVQNSTVAGLVTNPYFTTASELTRVHAQLPFRLAKEPDLAARMMLFGALTYGAASYAQQYASSIGLTPETVDYMVEAQPDYARMYRKATFPIPILYDDPAARKYPDGSPFRSFDLLDFTGALDMFRLTQGDPDDAPENRVILNLATMPLGGDLEQAMRFAAGATGFVTPSERNLKTPRLDERGAKQLILQTLAAGYGAQGVQRAMKAYERTKVNPMKPLEPVLTPQQALLQTFLPTQTVGELAPTQGTVARGAETKDYGKQYGTLLTSEKYQNASPEEQAKLRKLYEDKIAEFGAKEDKMEQMRQKALKSRQK